MIRNSSEYKNFKNNATKLILYNALVRSILEYCSVVWSPCYFTHINRIERVQKKFVAHLTHSCKKNRVLRSYLSRLKYFKMGSLADRRDMIDLVFLKKIVTGTFDCPDLLRKINFRVPFKTPRSCNIKLFSLSKHRSNLKLHCPLSRMFATYQKHQHHIDLNSSTFPYIKAMLGSNGIQLHKIKILS